MCSTQRKETLFCGCCSWMHFFFEWFPKHFPNQYSFRPIGKPESTRKSLSKKDVFNEVTQMDEKSHGSFSRGMQDMNFRISHHYLRNSEQICPELAYDKNSIRETLPQSILLYIYRKPHIKCFWEQFEKFLYVLVLKLKKIDFSNMDESEWCTNQEIMELIIWYITNLSRFYVTLYSEGAVVHRCKWIYS